MYPFSVENHLEIIDFSIENDFNLSDLASSGNGVILFFFPDSHSISCQIELKSFRDNYHKIKDLGWEVVGISTESFTTLETIKQKFSLNYYLVSDSDGVISDNLGILGKELDNPYLMPIAKRRTIVIDSNLEIVKYYENVLPKKHPEKIIDGLHQIMAWKMGNDYPNSSDTQKEREII